MTCRQVIKMGNPILREVAKNINVEEIKTKQVQELIQDLRATMYKYKGLGIAAPQIGISKQIFILQIPQYSERYGKLTPVPFTVVINPKITALTEQTQGFWQGCLSVPGIKGYVRRPKHIKVQCFNQKAQAVTLQLKGMPAVTYQHETDHLNGSLFIDKIEPKKIAFIEEFYQFSLQKTEKVLE